MGWFSNAIQRARQAMTISVSARWPMISWMDHFPGAGRLASCRGRAPRMAETILAGVAVATVSGSRCAKNFA